MNFDIGICAYNEEKTVNKLLKSLLSENFKNELGKIYVVCSGCTDRTEEVVKTYLKKYPNIFLIQEKERRGKPSAINKILQQKLAPILVFIAADNAPKKGSIDMILEKFKDDRVGGVNGHPIPEGGFQFNEILWIIHHYYLKYEDITDKLEHLTGEFCAFRPVFPKLPLNVLCDDAWIAIQLRKKNFKIRYVPSAISYFKSPINIFEYIKQRSRNLWGHSQINHRTLTIPLNQNPIYTIKVLFAALRNMNLFKFLFIAFLEAYCLLKSKFYKRGNVWEKISCSSEV